MGNDSNSALPEDRRLLPEDAPWVGLGCDFLAWAGEDSIPHDDDIDAFSQIINWARQRVYGLSTYYEQQPAKLSGKTNGQAAEQEKGFA